MGLLVHELIGLHGNGHRGGFQRDANVVKVIAVEQGDVPKGRIHQSLGRHTAVFRQQRLFQGPAVDPDADGDMFPGAGHGHGLHPVFPADVAGVDADLIRPGLDALQGQAIVKVDIDHQRQVDLFLDGPHGLGRRHVRHSHPDDLAPRRSQAANLGDRRRHVAGGGIGHRLHRHGSAAAHGHAPD